MDGVYQISLNTPMGKMSGKATLKTNGNSIEAIVEFMGSKNVLSNGKIQGNKCYFSGDIKNNVLNIKYELMGELVNNMLNIYAKTNMGEFKIQGKKIA